MIKIDFVRTLSRINATAPLHKGAKGRAKIKDYDLVSLTKGRWCEAPEGFHRLRRKKKMNKSGKRWESNTHTHTHNII